MATTIDSLRALRASGIAAIIVVAIAGSADQAAAQPTAQQQPPAQQPSPAPAQTTTLVDPGHFTFTPFVGIGFSGDLDNATGAVGIAGGYVWSSRVAFEAELNFLPSSESSGLVELDSDSWTVMANALYHFPGERWVPYGVFGLGFGHGSVDLDVDDDLDDDIDTSSNEFAVNFGGGVERRIRDRYAFRGDLRYFFGGDFVPDYWRLSAGLTFDLGRRQ
jgi:opacity protein-like surface antigen